VDAAVYGLNLAPVGRMTYQSLIAMARQLGERDQLVRGATRDSR
jgi:hypothetical protein